MHGRHFAKASKRGANTTLVLRNPKNVDQYLYGRYNLQLLRTEYRHAPKVCTENIFQTTYMTTLAHPVYL